MNALKNSGRLLSVIAAVGKPYNWSMGTSTRFVGWQYVHAATTSYQNRAEKRVQKSEGLTV